MWSFLLAIVIVYLLTCSLYESWSLPVIVMFSVLLPMTGDGLGLKLVNVLEPTVKVDVVTMLGFVILAGGCPDGGHRPPATRRVEGENSGPWRACGTGGCP